MKNISNDQMNLKMFFFLKEASIMKWTKDIKAVIF